MRRFCALAMVSALAGCSLAPHTVLPDLPVPPSWPVGDAYLAQAEADVPAVSYRDVFADERLHALIAQALGNNRDLRVAAANVAAARAQARVAQSSRFPEIGVGAGISRDSGANGRPASTTATITGGVSAFDLDVFGRLANASEAQRQRALATEAVARTVRLALVADLTAAWAQYAADAELLAIAEDTAQNARRTVALSRARLAGGVAPRTELRQAEQILATAEADVAAQITALAQDRNLLQLLAGGPVDPALLANSLTEVESSTRALPGGTRSDVLLRRPDVLAAEYGLRAADADIGVARAALFPRISLTGLLGVASESLASLFSGGAFHTTLGASGSQAIFSGGGVKAGVAVNEARRDAALAAYESAIQTAFREVADALARQGTIDRELNAVKSRTDAAADAARLTEARYRGGVASSLENLDAGRSVYAAQRALVVARLAKVANRVELYRVLGGDRFEGG